MTPPKLHIDGNGRLQGPANITWNSPWPTPDCSSGFGTAYGGVFHTEVGYEHSVIDEFNNLAAQASAFFSIGMDGHIHQYMPLGQGYKAWTQEAGNSNYRGVEHEDHGNDSNPLSAAQLTASAQVFEAMSAYDGWPLQATDNPNGGRGIIFHSDGGQGWGGHDCPGSVRRAQRTEIITLARAIRAGTPTPPAFKTWTTKGMLTLSALADQLHYVTHNLLRVTLLDSGQQTFGPLLAEHINTVFAGDTGLVPAGCWFYVPGPGPWTTVGLDSLAALAALKSTTPAAIMAATVERAPGHIVPDHTAKYINDVFARTTVKCPAGVVLHY